MKNNMAQFEVSKAVAIAVGIGRARLSPFFLIGKWSIKYSKVFRHPLGIHNG